jgi:hypothetical protein
MAPVAIAIVCSFFMVNEISIFLFFLRAIQNQEV